MERKIINQVVGALVGGVLAFGLAKGFKLNAGFVIVAAVVGVGAGYSLASTIPADTKPNVVQSR